jgi:gamma-glutamylputrescine oxidase
MTATTSLWLEEDALERPRTTLSGRPDVVVIGGGVTGCSCALTLAEAGVRVRLHEARRIAGGASGRNGGFALRGTAVPYDASVHMLGRVPARRLMEMTERGLEQIALLAGDAFRHVGSLRLASDAHEREALEREYHDLVADGFAAEWIDDLEPPLDPFEAAILHPPDGSLQPARWVARLAARAAAAGVEIVEGSAVDVDDALTAAEAVVVATDGFTATLLPEFASVIRPRRGQVIATEPLRMRLFDRPHYARWAYDYWHQTPEGRLVLGGRRDASLDTEETDVEETTAVVQQSLDAFARELVGTEELEITHRWAGIWGMTPDCLPMLGQVPGRDRVWVAAGYSGHGNVLGFVCGILVAEAILGSSLPPEAEPLAASRASVVEAIQGL